MKQYIVLLRGVNISGKNKIGMPVLKKELEDAGFSDVSTYLNSGNILLSAEDGNIRNQIEKIIREKFDLDIPVYVVEEDKLKELLFRAPNWWNSGDKTRYDNLIFILSDDRPEDICEQIGEPSDGLEEIQICDNVIFWTFDRTRYQKCKWWKKTASDGIAEKLTIRTANTILKLCGPAEGKDRKQ